MKVEKYYSTLYTTTSVVVIDLRCSCIFYSFRISIFANATFQQIHSCSTKNESVGLAEGKGQVFCRGETYLSIYLFLKKKTFLGRNTLNDIRFCACTCVVYWTIVH